MNEQQNNVTATSIGKVTAAEIQQWKAKYGKVFRYSVDGKECYLRPVDRNLYSLAASKISTSPAKFNEIVIDGIWLGGDDELRKEESYYFGLIDFVEEFMAKKKGSLQEL